MAFQGLDEGTVTRLGWRHNLEESGRISQSSEKFQIVTETLNCLISDFRLHILENIICFTLWQEKGVGRGGLELEDRNGNGEMKDDEQVTSRLFHVDFF